VRNSSWKAAIVWAIIALAACSVAAQDATKNQPEQQTPPMGPPAEMKQLASLVGTWDFEMKMHMSMDPTDTTWMVSKGVATFAYTVGDAVMDMTFEQPMMGQKFIGRGWETYDREKKEWQMTWVDNMGGRISLYTGSMTKDGSVFQGEDMMMGKPYLTRLSTTNATPTSYDWKGEWSMDGGKTWLVWAVAKYTKQK
jgi:hypothetical protein